MAKSKAKRPVGRPKKPKTAVKKNEGVFPQTFNVFKLNRFDGDRTFEWKFQDAFEQLRACLDETQRQLHKIDDAYWAEGNMKIGFGRQVLRSSMLIALLQYIFEASVERDGSTEPSEDEFLNFSFTQAQSIAIAFWAGQQSVIVPRKLDEPKYATGVKVKTGSEIGARQRRKARPAKVAIERALRSEMKKHGKKTLAVNNAATAFDVSKNTLRTWIKELSITF